MDDKGASISLQWILNQSRASPSRGVALLNIGSLNHTNRKMKMENHVLIMNADIGSCLLLKKLTTTLGYKCDVVHSMPDGLRAVAAKSYDLILISCLMQDRTCWVACQAIRSLYRGEQCPIIIGILSSPNNAMQQRCESCGMSGVVSHPVNKAALSECIERGAHALINNESEAICSESCGFIGNCGEQALPQVAGCGRNAASPKLVPLVDVSALQEAGPLYLGELNST